MKQDYDKIRPSLRYFLQGAQMFTALEAMNFGLKHHTGMRKDKTTPEYQHQISQAQYARTLLPSLMYPERTLVCILLHDVVEDCEVELTEIVDRFGSVTAVDVELMTNCFPDGTKKEKDSYYSLIASNPVTSFAKGCDRMHNHQSMSGVFSLQKMRDYIQETKDFLIPGLKTARTLFPRQEAAYQNIKSVLQIQMEWVELVTQELLTNV